MIYLSSSCVSNGTISEKLEKLGKITKNIELSGGSLFEKDISDKLLNEQHNGFNFLVHGYFPPSQIEILLNFADTSDEIKNFITESVKICKRLKIPYYSVHAGFKKDYKISCNRLFGGKKNFNFSGIDDNINWFNKTFPELELAIENLYPVGKDISTCFCMHPDEIIDLLSRFPRIKLLLDIGHLKVSGKYLNFDYKKAAEYLVEKFSDRIVEIHLSENNSNEDDHLIPDKSSFQYFFIKNYSSLIKKYKINLTLESRNFNLYDIELVHKKFSKLLNA